MITDAEYRAALSYMPHIVKAGRGLRLGQDTQLGRDITWVLLGIGSRETQWGTYRGLKVKGPACTGDYGHGRGLMQIDDRWHKEFIASGKWSDAEANIIYGAGVLRDAYRWLKRKGAADPLLLRASIAAYNAGAAGVWRAVLRGADPDAATTGRNYAADVLRRAASFMARVQSDYPDVPLIRLPLLPPQDVPSTPPKTSLP